ncbi:hypothetical protein LQ562_12630 [Acidovorax sp. D4N7]|uniref:Uncharacterized protein n=1 Tax=Comamonas endophytica TaxID=2949090 RepID=A0ABY6GHB2_9BURK|nr:MULTISPECIES: hypothetical protein [unclassified Acidovorax]MCD2513362.1 hypothetical protein [Acidovorax sp. D4N7]UYG53854.1 hypothetical protein M9799_18135 [Acidovorax sp. 5MLIR]
MALGQHIHAVQKVAKPVGKILVDGGRKACRREVRIVRLGQHRDQRITPVIGAEQADGVVGEDTALFAGGELAALVGQPAVALDGVCHGPGLARAQHHRRPEDAVEGHVVLGHELHQADFFRPLPPLPPGLRIALLSRPILGHGDIGDGRIEPDIEDLALPALERDRDAPLQVPRDAARMQPGIEPFPGNGAYVLRSAFARAYPVLKLRLQRVELQKDMPALAQLQFSIRVQPAPWLNQFQRIEQLAAAIALVAACRPITAMRAGPDDIAVRKKAITHFGEELLADSLLHEAVLAQAQKDLLRQRMVGWRGGAAEMVKADIEARIDIRLARMPLVMRYRMEKALIYR